MVLGAVSAPYLLKRELFFSKAKSPAAVSSAHHRGQLELYYTSSSPVLQLLYHAQRLTHAAEMGRSTEPLQALGTFGSHHSHQLDQNPQV